MRDITKMSNEDLMVYWKSCSNTICKEPYASMPGDLLEDEEIYATMMCLQSEFTNRNLRLPQ